MDQQLLQQIQQMEKEQEGLHRRIEALKTDPRAIEEIARNELGMVRSGEYVYRLTPGEPVASPTPLPPERPGQNSVSPSTRLPLAVVPVAVLVTALSQLRRKRKLIQRGTGQA